MFNNVYFLCFEGQFPVDVEEGKARPIVGDSFEDVDDMFEMRLFCLSNGGRAWRLRLFLYNFFLKEYPHEPIFQRSVNLMNGSLDIFILDDKNLLKRGHIKSVIWALRQLRVF